MPEIQGKVTKRLPDASSQYGEGAVVVLDMGDGELVRCVVWDAEDEGVNPQVGDVLYAREAKRGTYKKKTSFSVAAGKVEMNPSNGAGRSGVGTRGAGAGGGQPPSRPAVQLSLDAVLGVVKRVVTEISDGAIAERVATPIVEGVLSGAVVLSTEKVDREPGEDDEPWESEPDDLGF